MLVDVHAHLDSKFFGTDVEGVIERAKKAGIVSVIANGVDKDTNREVLKLSKKFDIIKPALGIYPPDALETENKNKRDWDIDEELDFIKDNLKKIIAIGEIGLDFKNGSDKELQEKVFRRLIEVGKNHSKPLIIHSRKAEREVIKVLEEYGYKKIIMHCFSGKKKLVHRIIDNGWMFSIPANVVRSEQMQYIVKECPITQLLTETDAPFLSPFKDKRNEPAYVVETIGKMSELKDLEEKEVINSIYMNYQRMFL